MFDNVHEFRHESSYCEVHIREDGRGNLIRVYSKDRGKGHASGLLRAVTEWADENGIELYLTAQGYGGPVQTMLDQNQLIKFYEKFGFERLAGDDGCMSHVPMVRVVY